MMVNVIHFLFPISVQILYIYYDNKSKNLKVSYINEYEFYINYNKIIIQI